MRLDKYLKVSRLIKRRTVAQEAASAERVSVNGRAVKPAYQVKIGDEIGIRFGNSELKVKVLSVKEAVKKEEATEMYEVISEN